MTSCNERVITYSKTVRVPVTKFVSNYQYLLLLNFRHEIPLYVWIVSSLDGGGDVPAEQPQLAGVGEHQGEAGDDVQGRVGEQSVDTAGP